MKSVRITQKQRSLQSNRRGSMMPAIAFAFVVCGGCMALVLNSYWLSGAQEDLRTVAQAAALAGAQQLVNDDILKPDFDSQNNADHVRHAVEYYSQGNPGYGSSRPKLDVQLERIVVDPETGRKQAISTDEFPTTVTVHAHRDSHSGNPVAMILPAFTGRVGADVGVKVEATVNNRIVGLRPVGAGKIPVWPLVVLQASALANVASWESTIESGLGTDLYGWDDQNKVVTNEPDGLFEMTLTFPNGGLPGNMQIADLGTGFDPDALIQQFQTGVSASQLNEFGGILATGQSEIALEAMDSLEPDVDLEIRNLIGHARIVSLYLPTDRESNSDSPPIISATRLVAVRLMAVHQSQYGVHYTIQPAVVTTRTAIVDDDAILDPDAPGNPYIYNISITE